MAMRAEGITAKNLQDRLETPNADDELGHLASVFNHLLDRLEGSFDQLQRFTADAAHELRTPIAALRTVGEVALTEDRGEHSCKEALSSILEETSRLSETIDALLLLARAEATQGGREPDTWHLKSIVNEVLALLGVLCEEKDLSIREESVALAEDRIRADRGLLRTALMNVFHNAIKFSPRGGSIRVSYASSETDPRIIRLLVQDEGPGIPVGEHERVFERFFTSSARETAASSGTGLGLSVAKLIIERLGGSIRFDVEATGGARCLIELSVVSSGQ
jgi:signal transduction histidine kinase